MPTNRYTPKLQAQVVPPFRSTMFVLSKHSTDTVIFQAAYDKTAVMPIITAASASAMQKQGRVLSKA